MDAVEDVKSRLNVEDVIAEYVQLKRAGRNFKGLSPFGNEKTPSFMVSPEKQIWHDFSSGRGGNIFSFIMEVEGLDFKGALELLARKAGVDLEQYRTKSSGQRGQQKERLYEIMDQAANFYQVQLTKNNEALKYVREKREFSKQTILTWRLGYAPNNFDSATRYLRSKGYTDQELKSAGISILRRGTLGDMFRERIMIPLADAQGRVIGFTARLLRDIPDAPKYINTPQTPLYDKGRHVYGLHLAKEMIRKSAYVVVAEGNLDVIASHQAGVTQVVASAGTAMTEMHLRELKRFTGDIRLAFDQDQAGLSASERVIPLASKVGVALSIVTIQGAKDPDELIRRNVNDWQEAITKPIYAFDWLIERYAKSFNISTGIGKRQFVDTILVAIRSLNDTVEQKHYLQKVAERVGVSSEALEDRLRGATAEKRTKKITHLPEPVLSTVAPERKRHVDHLMSLVLLQPKLRVALSDIKSEMLYGVAPRALLQFLKDTPDFAGDPKSLADLHDHAEYVKILTFIYEELYAGLEISELRAEATRLQTRVIEDYIKDEKNRLAGELTDASDEQVTKLLKQARKLDVLRGKLTKE